VNECERKMLGQDRLGAGKRLACQTTLTTSGEVMVRPAPIVASAEKNKDAKKLFRELSLSQQIGALIELEAITVTEAMNTLRGKSIALVDRFLNLKPKKLAESQAHRDGAKGTL